MIPLLIGALTGLLIGTVGVGGILLAPLLVLFMGMELHLALATASWSFLFTGIAGTVAYARRGMVDWSKVGWLSLAILPAATLGALVNTLLATPALTLVLAALIVASGLNALLRGRPATGERAVTPPGLLLMGSVTGFGSALTGTGGPVLWLPLATVIEMPAPAAVGVSQAIQLPIAVFATAGFILFGEIDFGLGLLLGVVQAGAVMLGAHLAHWASPERLSQLVALALVGAGAFMLARVLLAS